MLTATRTLIVCDIAAMLASLWLGYQIRFDFAVPEAIRQTYPFIFLWVTSLKAFSLWRLREFRTLPGYFSLSDSLRLFWVLLLPALLTFAVSSRVGSDFAPPRSVVLTDFCFSLIGLTAIRLAFRPEQQASPSHNSNLPHKRVRRAGIIGAGLVGTALLREFNRRRDLGLQAVAFFDDDRMKWGKRIQDVLIVGAPESMLNEHADLELEEVVIAMPSAQAKRVTEIAQLLHRLQIKFSTVPSIYELTTGQAHVGQLRPVEPTDLLGRKQVQLAGSEIQQTLKGKEVMVTGAGGSIGSELCRQIAAYAPKELLLLDQSEIQLFQIEQELLQAKVPTRIVPIIADVLDRTRTEQLFRKFRPQVIFHAAAHKHVPMMEFQPGEAIKNNALGTFQLAELSAQYGVDRFVLISSDKAINPTSVMGATKRLAEMCVQSLSAANPSGSQFMAVRFGNVLDSSGSVVPIFRSQIARGGPVQVTHPEVTRYFMTIPEAVGLVLQSAAQGRGGEIFLLDMGKPVKILDLARQLIELSGCVPDRDIRIEFTGLRPGEKLFEELSYEAESMRPTSHPKIYRLVCEATPLDHVKYVVHELAAHADRLEPEQLKQLLKNAVPEYHPEYSPAAATPERAVQATPSNARDSKPVLTTLEAVARGAKSAV